MNNRRTKHIAIIGSAVSLDKKTLQGEILIKNAESNAILLFLKMVLVKKYIKITDKTPKIAFGRRRANIVLPKNLREIAIIYGKPSGL